MQERTEKHMAEDKDICNDHENRVTLIERIVDRHEGQLKEHSAALEDLKRQNNEQTTNIKLIQKDIEVIKETAKSTNEKIESTNTKLEALLQKPIKAYDKYKDTIITIIITAIVTGIIAKLIKGW